MLRPATPLSILFFAAFCLLLLSTLSTPVIKAIPIATYRGVNFGVLGYCENGVCNGPSIGYDTDKLFKDGPPPDFSLPSNSRHALSSILIVHPVAALMTLICFGLAVAAHFHSPAHSPRYLLALLIFTFPTLLVTLLAFLVDILLFVPHVAWGGWIVLAATIIIVASGIVTCAMRRTLVSRKARKRRIAENEDMNGQTYYANRADAATLATEFPKAESPPPLSGDTVTSGPRNNAYAAYDLQKTATAEDMTPLNQRNPSLKTVSSAGGNGSDSVPMPQQDPSGRRQPVDQYGHPIPPMPQDNFMMNGPPRGSPGRGGPYRGRGGPPRGGPFGGPRGGYGPRGGMRGPPPPGWNGNGRGMRPPQGVPMMGPGGRGGPMMGPGGRGGPMMGPGGRGAPPPGYNNYNNNSNNNNNFYSQGGPPSREVSPYRGPSPPGPMPIGQAIEMDDRGGTPPIVANNQNYGLRESDGDVQGMLALQQGGFPADAPQRLPSNPMSPTSAYSTDSGLHPLPYVPARAGWNQQTIDQPVSTLNNSNGSRGLSPIQDSPTELPAHALHGSAPAPTHTEQSSEYYEDVDPKFAEPQRSVPQPMPTSLRPGGYAAQPPAPNPTFLAAPYQPGNSSDPNLPRTSSYDDLPDGSRSPAASDTSHFTSVSQRPVNPDWRPEMGAPAGQFQPYGTGRRPLRQEDVILEANAANPDFAIPGAMPGRGRGRGRGRGGRGGTTGPPPPATIMGPGPGLGSQSRYPGANL